MSRLVRTVVVVAHLLVSLSACANAAPAAVHERNDPRQFPDLSPLVQPLPADASLTPDQPGGRLPQAHEWDTADVSDDGRTLLVRYVDNCGWLDGAEVAETDTTVTVTIRLAGAGDQPADEVCFSIGVTNIARVELAEPLRGRLVLDGYDGRPRPVLRQRD